MSIPVIDKELKLSFNVMINQQTTYRMYKHVTNTGSHLTRIGLCDYIEIKELPAMKEIVNPLMW